MKLSVVVVYVNVLKVNASEVFPHQYAASHIKNRDKGREGKGRKCSQIGYILIHIFAAGAEFYSILASPMASKNANAK